MRVWLLVLCLGLTACVSPPKGVQPVTPFDQAKYLGTWYEIARLDHSFERGLSRVTAEYSLNDDGSIKVINRGFNFQKNEWKQADGRALEVQGKDVGHLKVSFFGPFYGAYVVAGIDPDYQHVWVTGPNHKYLWIMSRKPQMPADVFANYLSQAAAAGFAVDQLIIVNQEPL